jgi:hypothetical protein
MAGMLLDNILDFEKYYVSLQLKAKTLWLTTFSNTGSPNPSKYYYI